MWTDPTKGQDDIPHNGRTPPRVMTTVHEMDEPNQGHKLVQVQQMDEPNQGYKLISPVSGRTPTRFMTPVHDVDGPNQGTNLYMSMTWTDPTMVKTQVHDVDGPNKVNIKAISSRTDHTLPSSTK